MKICLLCGQSADDDALNCPACGAALPTDTAYAENHNTTAPSCSLSEEIFDNTSSVHDASNSSDDASDHSIPLPPPKKSNSISLQSRRIRRWLIVCGIIVVIFFSITIFWKINSTSDYSTDQLQNLSETIAAQYNDALDAARSSLSMSVIVNTNIDEDEDYTIYSFSFYLQTEPQQKEEIATLNGLDYHKDEIIDALDFSVCYTTAMADSENSIYGPIARQILCDVIDKTTSFHSEEIWPIDCKTPSWGYTNLPSSTTFLGDPTNVALLDTDRYLNLFKDSLEGSWLFLKIYFKPSNWFGDSASFSP